MRVKINFSKNTEPVIINNQHLLNGFIHKCLGKNNDYHDTWSGYCISSLLGGKLNEDKKTLSFDNGGYILVTSRDESFIGKFFMGAMQNPDLFCGMKLTDIEYIDEKFNKEVNHFVTLSPFIIKEKCNIHGERYITMEDENFVDKVKEHTIRKLKRIDSSLNLDSFDITIPDRHWHRTKRIMVGKSFCFANHCQISIKCNERIGKLLYHVGIGKSTGSGFGTIAKTESSSLYF